jgi:hypothetical protein
MKTNKYVKILLDNGLNVKTISKLTESQIKVLAEKFIVSEQWTKQQSTETKYSTPLTNLQGGKPAAVPPPTDPSKKTMVGLEGGKLVVTQAEGEMKEDDTINIVDDPAATADGIPTTEGEMKERFKSTAQQKFFWNKCTKSGDKKSKWCKWANEFQSDTKDKDLPKKLHPEKTVKVKTESYEKFLEDSIVEMVDRYINPAMTKSQLVNTINEKVNKSESFMLRKPKKNSMFSQDEGKEMKTMKRPIGRMFSLGEDTKEKERTRTKPDTDTDKKEKKPGKKNPYEPKHNPAPKAGDTKEKERTKTREKEKDKDRKNPYEPKHNPAPKAKKEVKENTTTTPTRPGTKERTKEKGPGKKNPYEPKHNPAPKAGRSSLPNFLKWDKLGVNLK